MQDVEDLFRAGTLDASFSETEVVACRAGLLEWYRTSRRKLPWRGDEADSSSGFKTPQCSAYGTWVSEIMLQQTRVETVIPYWHRWMEKWPTVASLAAATPEEVNAVWAGLGYYRRAQSLLTGARDIVGKFGGVVPDNIVQLREVKGIGPYTAGAIASIAYGKPEPLVDGNVLRVLSRLRAMTTEVGASAMDKAAWRLCGQLVDPQDPGAFNQALMELGATVCTPKSPTCGSCPVRDLCLARQLVEVATAGAGSGAGQGQEEDGELSGGLPVAVTYFPRKVAKKRPKEVLLSVGVLRARPTSQAQEQGQERFLFVRRPPGGLLENQWEFPTVVLWQEGPAKAKGKAKAKAKAKGKDKQKNQEEEEDEEDDEEGEGEREDEQGSQADTSAPALWGPFPQLLREHARVAWVGEAGAEEEEGEDSVFRVRTLASSSAAPTTTLPEPIVHLFSHQRHSMHVHITDVSLEVLNVDEAGHLDRVRWMSALEIRAAGITTGCKKVLDAVCVPSSPSATNKKRAGAGATRQKEKKTKQEGGAGSITSFFKLSGSS